MDLFYYSHICIACSMTTISKYIPYENDAWCIARYSHITVTNVWHKDENVAMDLHSLFKGKLMYTMLMCLSFTSTKQRTNVWICYNMGPFPIKIRRSWNRRIFMIGIHILVKRRIDFKTSHGNISAGYIVCSFTRMRCSGVDVHITFRI